MSKDPSGRGKSVEQQHAENAEVADEQGWDLGEPYAEPDAISASRYARGARGGFAALMDDLTTGRFGADILLLWEASRGSRRAGEWVSLADACEDHGVRIHITSDERTYDPAIPRDRKSLLESAIDSEYESAKTAKRIGRDIRAAAREGKPHGKLTYGYRRLYDWSDDGSKRTVAGQEPHEVHGPIVTEVFGRFAAGETLYAIAADLTARGIPTPTRKGTTWRGSTIGDLIRNPAYLGERWHKDTRAAAKAWKRLVDPDVFAVAQRRLNDPTRSNRADTAAAHLLSGIATCGVCGGPLYYTTSGKRRLGVYGCKSAGFHVARSARMVDDFVERRVVALLQGRQDLQVAGSGGDEQVAADAAVQTLVDRRDHAADQYAAGDISAATLARVEAQLQPRITAAEKAATRLRASRALASMPDGPIGEAWWQMSLAAQRTLLRDTVTVVVHPTDAGRKTGRGVLDESKVVITPRW